MHCVLVLSVCRHTLGETTDSGSRVPSAHRSNFFLACPQFVSAGTPVNPNRTLDKLTQSNWDMGLMQFSNEDLVRAVIYHISLLDITTASTEQAAVKREIEELNLEGIEFDRNGQIKDKGQRDRIQQMSEGNLREKIKRIFESISGAFEWRTEQLKTFTTFRSMAEELQDIDQLNDNEVGQVLLQYHYSELHYKTEVCVLDSDR